MLAQEVVKEYGGRARFAVQDLGASPLAERYGVDKYPAVFVDDALVARPEDFYAWGGPPTGKYLPFSSLENRRRFQSDLQRMLEIRLGGGDVPSLTATRAPKADRFLPADEMVDLSGKKFHFAQLRGKPVIVEFWATWCPFCLDTLTWLKQMDSSSVSVVGLAVDSEAKAIDEVIRKLQPPGRVMVASPKLREEFDGPPAVPTLLLADSNGKIVRIFYGAPRSLHQDLVAELAKMR